MLFTCFYAPSEPPDGLTQDFCDYRIDDGSKFYVGTNQSGSILPATRTQLSTARPEVCDEKSPEA